MMTALLPPLSRVLIVGVLSLAGLRQAFSADLWDIYTLALQNDSGFQAAKFEYEAAKLQLPLAKTGFRPAIVSSAGAGKQRTDFSGSTQTEDDNQLNVNLDLPFFDRTLRREINQAELLQNSASIQLENARHDLILRVSDAYFRLLATIDNREVALKQKITIQRQMDLASERLDVGLGTQTDLFDAQARYQQANADAIQAEILIDNAVQTLVTIIGEIPASIAPLSEDAPLDPPDPNSPDLWVTRALENNLLLRLEELNVAVASEEIEKQRAARSPVFAVNANQRWQENADDSSNSSIRLVMDWPLYLGGSIRLRTQQAGFQYNTAEQVRNGLRGQIQADTTSTFLAVNSGISQVNALAEAIRAGTSALQAKEEGFSAGLTTNLDVLDAQRDLSRSKTDYLGARYNYILTVLELEQAAGDLDETDVQRINSWLQGDAAEISLQQP